MKRHELRRIAWPLAAACALFAGCQSKSDQKIAATPTPTIEVERPDAVENLTPDQRKAQFVYSYETGMEMIRREQFAHAMGAFEEALRLNPDSTETMFNLAACYDSIGDPLRAIQIYRRLLNETPNDPDCHANLGTAFIKMYYRERSPAWRKMAWESWERSLRLNPEQPEVAKYLERSKSAE